MFVTATLIFFVCDVLLNGAHQCDQHPSLEFNIPVQSRRDFGSKHRRGTRNHELLLEFIERCKRNIQELQKLRASGPSRAFDDV